MSTAPTTSRDTVPAVARPGAGFRRTTAVACLVAAPVLAAVSELLQPDLGDSTSDRLAAMAGTGAAISAAAFVLSQLPTLVAVLAIGHLLTPRSRRLAAFGTVLGVLGAFGHTVFGGISLVWVAMANDGAAHRATYAALIDDMTNGPVMLFSVVGLLGTVLGILLLSIGLFRAQVGPRWVGPALWAFLLVEFVGTSLSRSASYLSVLCFAAAFLGLAGYAARQPLAAWAVPVTDRG